jgi:hypothetical protein
MGHLCRHSPKTAENVGVDLILNKSYSGISFEMEDTMTLNEIINNIHTPLVAKRDTIDEAFDYALMVAKASENPMAVMAAVYVVTNTIAKQLKEMDNA